MTQNDGQGPEYYLNLIFEKFEDQEKRLSETAKLAEEAMNALLSLIRKGEKVFDDEVALYASFDGFKKVMGHTNHLVIYIELQHKRLNQPEVLAQTALKQAEMNQQQQTLPLATSIANAPGEKSDYGFWHFMGERRRSIALEHVFGQNKQTQIATTERQSEFMNYARDIPPELNKIYEWLGGTLLRLKRFRSETSRSVCYSLLRTHLEKLAAQVVGFSNATIELRKELVGEREVAYAQAMSALEQAKYLAQNQPMSIAQYYQRQRMEMGSQDVGEK